MPDKSSIRAEADRLLAVFVAEGAVPVEADILQPAGTLLDLYGEDIRGRAYITRDAVEGEQMLRPDFTVPVVLHHMRGGGGPMRYAYAGEVFRRQEDGAGRAREYIQVGYELFDQADPARADAEVFATFAAIVAPLGLRAVTGDIGVLSAAVRGLHTSERRRAALMRHLWRPRRFRALLDRFAGRAPVPPTRAALLAAADPLAGAGPELGLRSREDVEARIAALREDAAEPPIPATEVDMIDDILALRAPAPAALSTLRDIAVDMPAIGDAVNRLARRLDALAARGVDTGALAFEAAYGRTHMEYYDGFVFGFTAEDHPDMPPVATGGRYDALTRVLGQGRTCPAVGGVVRPGLLLMLAEAGA